MLPERVTILFLSLGFSRNYLGYLSAQGDSTSKCKIKVSSFETEDGNPIFCLGSISMSWWTGKKKAHTKWVLWFSLHWSETHFSVLRDGEHSLTSAFSLLYWSKYSTGGFLRPQPQARWFRFWWPSPCWWRDGCSHIFLEHSRPLL